MVNREAKAIELMSGEVDLLDSEIVFGELLCPLTQDPYVDPESSTYDAKEDADKIPMLLGCGHTVSKGGLKMGLDKCPLCRVELEEQPQPIVNTDLLKAMRRLVREGNELQKNVVKPASPSAPKLQESKEAPAEKESKLEDKKAEKQKNFSASEFEECIPTTLLGFRFKLLETMLSEQEKVLVPQLPLLIGEEVDVFGKKVQTKRELHSFNNEDYIKAMRYAFSDLPADQPRYFIRPTLTSDLTMEAEVVFFHDESKLNVTLPCSLQWTEKGLIVKYARPGQDPVNFKSITEFLASVQKDQAELQKDVKFIDDKTVKQAQEAKEAKEAKPQQPDALKPALIDGVTPDDPAPAQEETKEQLYAKQLLRLSASEVKLASAIELAKVRREQIKVEPHDSEDIKRVRAELKDEDAPRHKERVQLPKPDDLGKACMDMYAEYVAIAERMDELTERPPVQFYNAKLHRMLQEFSHAQRCDMPRVYDAGGQCLRFETDKPAELEKFLLNECKLYGHDCFSGKEPALAVSAAFADDIRWQSTAVRGEGADTEYMLPEATLYTATRRVYQFAQHFPRLGKQSLRDAEQHKPSQVIPQLTQEGIDQMQQFYMAQVVSVEQSNTASANGKRNLRTILQGKQLGELLERHAKQGDDAKTQAEYCKERNVVFVSRPALEARLGRDSFSAKVSALRSWTPKKGGESQSTLLVVTGHGALAKEKIEKDANLERYEAWIVDLSGSMNGDKLEFVKSVLHETKNKLKEPGDADANTYVSLIGYEGISARSIASGSISDVTPSIDKMVTGGSTPTGQALRKAVKDYIAHAGKKNPPLIPPCFRLYTDGDYDEEVEEFCSIVESLRGEIEKAGLPLPVFRVFAIQMNMGSPKAKVGFEKLANTFPGSSIIPISEFAPGTQTNEQMIKQMVAGIPVLEPRANPIPLQVTCTTDEDKSASALPAGQVNGGNKTFTFAMRTSSQTKQIQFSVPLEQEDKLTHVKTATVAVPEMQSSAPTEDDEILYGMALGREALINAGVKLPDSLDCIEQAELKKEEKANLIVELQRIATIKFRNTPDRIQLAALAYINQRLPEDKRVPLLDRTDGKEYSPYAALQNTQETWKREQLAKFNIDLKDRLSCAANIDVLRQMRAVAALCCFDTVADELSKIIRATPTLAQVVSEVHKSLTTYYLSENDGNKQHAQFNVAAGTMNGMNPRSSRRVRYRFQTTAAKKVEIQDPILRAKAEELRNLYDSIAELEAKARTNAAAVCAKYCDDQSQFGKKEVDLAVSAAQPVREAFSKVSGQEFVTGGVIKDKVADKAPDLPVAGLQSVPKASSSTASIQKSVTDDKADSLSQYINKSEQILLNNATSTDIGIEIKHAINRWKNHCLSIAARSTLAQQDKNEIASATLAMQKLLLLASDIDNMKYEKTIILGWTYEKKDDKTKQFSGLKAKVKNTLEMCGYSRGLITPEDALKSICKAAHAAVAVKAGRGSHSVFVDKVDDILNKFDEEYTAHRTAAFRKP